jgi:hypothetical protein
MRDAWHGSNRSMCTAVTWSARRGMRWWFFTIAGRPHGTDSFVEFASRRRPI